MDRVPATFQLLHILVRLTVSPVNRARVEDYELVPRESLQLGKIDMSQLDFNNQSLHALDDLRFSLDFIRVDFGHEVMFYQEV